MYTLRLCIFIYVKWKNTQTYIDNLILVSCHSFCHSIHSNFLFLFPHSLNSNPNSNSYSNSCYIHEYTILLCRKSIYFILFISLLSLDIHKNILSILQTNIHIFPLKCFKLSSGTKNFFLILFISHFIFKPYTKSIFRRPFCDSW